MNYDAQPRVEVRGAEHGGAQVAVVGGIHGGEPSGYDDVPDFRARCVAELPEGAVEYFG